MKPYFAGLLAVIGLIAANSAPARGGDQWPYQRSIERTVTPKAASLLDVRNDNGDVHLTAADTTTVSIRARVHAHSTDELAQTTLDAAQQGDRVVVSATCPRVHRFFGYTDACVVDYEIVYPRSLAVSVVATNGDVNIENAHGDVNAHLTNGDVTVRDASAALDLSSRRGDVTASLASDWSSGAIHLASSMGDVKLTVPSGFNEPFEARTHMGDINNNAHLPQSGTPHVHLSTLMGDITIRRP